MVGQNLSLFLKLTLIW